TPISPVCWASQKVALLLGRVDNAQPNRYIGPLLPSMRRRRPNRGVHSSWRRGLANKTGCRAHYTTPHPLMAQSGHQRKCRNVASIARPAIGTFGFCAVLDRDCDGSHSQPISRSVKLTTWAVTCFKGGLMHASSKNDSYASSCFGTGFSCHGSD